MSNAIPDLRFRDFTTNWEERKLGDEFEKVNERNDGSFDKNNWISVAKMYFQDPNKVQSNNIDTRTYVMRKGDIAFEGHPNNEFQFGRFVVNDIGPGVVSELFPIYRHILEYNNYYWKNAIQLESIMAPIFAKSITSSGNSSNKLDTKHFLRQKIYVASFKEQQKIGTFFKRVDESIALHQHALDLLKQRKKAFLQKMFPKKGESVPEIRFSQFTEEWKQYKLGEVKDVRDGTHDSPTYQDTGYPLITSKNLNYSGLDMKNVSFISEKDFHLINKRSKVDIGDILFGMIGTIGNPVLVKTNDFAIKNVALIKNGNEISNTFLIQLLKSPIFNKYIVNENVGNTQKFLGLGKIREFPLYAPSIIEQEKIGNFFKELDDSISLQEEKLESLKQMKKAFLQKMFV